MPQNMTCVRVGVWMVVGQDKIAQAKETKYGMMPKLIEVPKRGVELSY